PIRVVPRACRSSPPPRWIKKKPGSVPGFFSAKAQAIGRICTACLPLGPSFTSNSTFWFSLRVLKPLPWISEKWAKRSSPPPSGLMKPKPLESLNHFTVPVLIAFPFIERLPDNPREREQRTKGTARRELKLDAGSNGGTWRHCVPYRFTASEIT